MPASVPSAMRRPHRPAAPARTRSRAAGARAGEHVVRGLAADQHERSAGTRDSSTAHARRPQRLEHGRAVARRPGSGARDARTVPPPASRRGPPPRRSVRRSTTITAAGRRSPTACVDAASRVTGCALPDTTSVPAPGAARRPARSRPTRRAAQLARAARARARSSRRGAADAGSTQQRRHRRARGRRRSPRRRRRCGAPSASTARSVAPRRVRDERERPTGPRRRAVASIAARHATSRTGFCGSRAKAVRAPARRRSAGVRRPSCGPTSGIAGNDEAPSPRRRRPWPRRSPRRAGPRSAVSIFLSSDAGRDAATSSSASRTRARRDPGASVRLCVFRTTSGSASSGGGVRVERPHDHRPGHGSSAAPTSQAPVRSSAMTRSAPCTTSRLRAEPRAPARRRAPGT